MLCHVFGVLEEFGGGWDNPIFSVGQRLQIEVACARSELPSPNEHHGIFFLIVLWPKGCQSCQ